MVIVHRLAGGQPYAIEVRPDATVRTWVSAENNVAEIVFADSSMVSCTLILPADVARQVFGQELSSLRPLSVQAEDDRARHRLWDGYNWQSGGGGAR
ncbi:MAG TPA: hypothetical protein VHX38_17810 [Pseudonocardiaceae bacterium]|jgi:hypothetical protein|nr:hypothetical protein [Pseudonocardiaceae bacterium]